MKISIGQNGNSEAGGMNQNPNQNGESFFKKRYQPSRGKGGGGSHIQENVSSRRNVDEKENKVAMRVLDIIIRMSIFITVFFLPLFFWVNVPSVLELNKQTFLIVVVGIGFLSWVGKMAWKNEIRFKKSFYSCANNNFLGSFWA